MVDFLFAITEHFSLALAVETFISRYWSKLAFLKGVWVTLSANFQWKRTSLTNVFWYQKTRVITLSCGVKISAVCSFFSKRSMHVTDGQTDEQIDKIMAHSTGGGSFHHD